MGSLDDIVSEALVMKQRLQPTERQTDGTVIYRLRGTCAETEAATFSVHDSVRSLFCSRGTYAETEAATNRAGQIEQTTITRSSGTCAKTEDATSLRNLLVTNFSVKVDRHLL